MLQLGLLFLLISPSASAFRWNGANDPAIMGEDFVYELDRLPTQAELPRRPWSETYWPANKGSINIRWNQARPVGFGYRSPTRAEVRAMTQEQLKALAPSEKYDIFMGRYNYPLRDEVSEIAWPGARYWAGICDGWSVAAIQYAEPQPVTLPNPDGILVPFGSSDIKGLMSYYAARHFDYGGTHQVGLRCKQVSRLLGFNSCADMNAGSVHVILANMIGLKKQAFIAEIDPGKEIWNQPVYGFKFQLLGSAEPDAGARGVRVKGTLIYTDELDNSQWEPVTGTSSFAEGKLELDYVLDLDSAGRIIGGRWTGKRGPDFAWFPSNQLRFEGDLDGLNRLYRPVQSHPTEVLP